MTLPQTSADLRDAIDEAAGIVPGDPRFDLRRRRPEFVDGAEDCRVSTLTPADDLGLSPNLRAAIKHRVLSLHGVTDDNQIAEDAEFGAFASGSAPETLPAPLASLARHVDMITCDPGQAGPTDLDRLQSAGFSVPQIVALSELLAYVCFQTRITATLVLLKDTK